MALQLITPTVPQLNDAVDALRAWQHDDAALQLHPGDLGWFQRFGAEATAAAVRVWVRDGRLLAVGLLDGPEVLRLTVAPEAAQDEDLAQRIRGDVHDPAGGVLGAGRAAVEVPAAMRVHAVLAESGWTDGEAWTPLVRDLTEPVDDPGVRVEIIGPERAAERAGVQRAAFPTSTFTEERWRDMAAGPAYADARCLLAYDGDTAVATATVWSAGPGRPGLLEPLGVHAEHRGRGHGRAICLAAAAALRELGSSTAVVCTPSANLGGVAAYESAGFRRGPERLDLDRPESG